MSFAQLQLLPPRGDVSLTRSIAKNFSVYRRPRWFRAALLCLLSSFVYHFVAETFYQSGSVSQLRADILEAEVNAISLNHTTVLFPRAPAVTWDKAIQTGDMIICLVDGTTEAAQAYLDRFKPGQKATSSWTNPDSLAANGWLTRDNEKQAGFTDAFDSIFTSIGLNVANNVFKNWRQLNTVIYEKREYQVSKWKSASQTKFWVS